MSTTYPDPATTDWVPLGYGAAVMPDVPAARVYRTTNLSIAHNTITTIPWEAKSWDTNGIWNPAPSGAPYYSWLVCKTAGKYLVWGVANFTANATGDRYWLVMVNGVAAMYFVGRAPAALNSESAFQPGSTVLNLAVGDYVEMRVYQDSGAALALVSGSANATEFGIAYLGPGNIVPMSQAGQVPQPVVEGQWLRGQGGVPVWQQIKALTSRTTGHEHSFDWTTGTGYEFLVDGVKVGALDAAAASPPSSPVDGQMWAYAPTSGVRWMFRYNAALAGEYPWEFVGGPEWRVSASDWVTVYNQWTAIEPHLTIPRAGVWQLTTECTYGAGGPTAINHGPGIWGESSPSWFAILQVAGNQYFSLPPVNYWRTCSGGEGVYIFAHGGSGNCQLYVRQTSILPVRIR